MILYTIGCPQCKVLEAKLAKANFDYETCSDMAVMRAKHMLAMPMLELDDGSVLNFSQAIKWLKEQA